MVGLGDGEVSSGGPAQTAAVLDALSERRSELDNVGGRALEEKDGDSVEGGGLPGDGEGLALGHNLRGDESDFLFVSEVSNWEGGRKHTSFKGRVMGLPFGSPTAGWIWAAAKPAKMEIMVALEYIVIVDGGVFIRLSLGYRWEYYVALQKQGVKSDDCGRVS